MKLFFLLTLLVFSGCATIPTQKHYQQEQIHVDIVSGINFNKH